MPGSQIVAIYEALAAITVSVGGMPSPRVWQPFNGSIKMKVERNELPLIIWLPGGSQQTPNTWTMPKLGITTTGTWNIDAILLIEGAGLGKQPPTSIHALVIQYAAAYRDAFAKATHNDGAGIPHAGFTTNSWVLGGDDTPDMLQYPAGAEGDWFWGIYFKIRIQEACTNV